ncbi:hypothetical protein D3C72_1363640 [compost metagenome]
MAGDVGQADRMVVGQRVLGGGDEVQGVLPHRHGLDQVVRLGCQGDNGNLGAAMEDFVVGLFRIHELNIQRHCRVFPCESPQQRGKAVQADMVAGGQGQATTHFTGQIGQCAPGIIEDVEDLVGAGQQGAAGLGQGHLAAQPVEQAHIQLLFQPGDALADGRLGQEQAVGRPGKATGFGNRDEGAKVRQIHGVVFLLVIQSIKIMNLSYSI